jgi:hypothetical protein
MYKVLRISALILGFLPASFFLIFLIGAAISELIDGKPGVIPILAMMLVTVSGYILAWKRPRNGGIIMIGGASVMGIYLIITTGFSYLDIAALYALPFIIPGILFMLLRKFQPVLKEKPGSGPGFSFFC